MSVPDNLDNIIIDRSCWYEKNLGLWKGWRYNSKINRYYFDDIGSKSYKSLWEDEFLARQ